MNCDAMEFDNIKSVLWGDTFHLGASAANEFCEWAMYKAK